MQNEKITYFIFIILIILSFIYFYITTNKEEVNIHDCTIQYLASDYELKPSSAGYMLEPKSFGLQYLFINFFKKYNENRKDFIKEIKQKNYSLVDSVENSFEIYKGHSHSENNFTKDTIEYYIIGKTFYIQYLNKNKHIQGIIDSCKKTWIDCLSKSND